MIHSLRTFALWEGGDPFGPTSRIYHWGPHCNCDEWDLERLPMAGNGVLPQGRVE